MVQDEGSSVGDHLYITEMACKDKCEETEKCQSFTYCRYSTNCHLKDKKITGTEPKSYYAINNCFTTYKTCDNGTQKKYIVT